MTRDFTIDSPGAPTPGEWLRAFASWAASAILAVRAWAKSDGGPT